MRKKITAVLAAALMLLSAVPSSAFQTYGALSADFGGKTFSVQTGVRLLDAQAYIHFSNVDFTGAKSICVSARCNMSGGGDGDWLAVRIDSPTGKLLGYVDVGVHTPTEAKNFYGAIEPCTGTHELYLVSTTGTEGSQCVEVSEVKLSDMEYKKDAYVPVSNDVLINHHETTWAATDDLGRKVADYEEAGPFVKGKSVGMFYWTWHSSFEDATALNMSEFAKQHPEAKYDYNNPAWPSGNISYFWNEPIFGYYAGIDYWVYRRHAELLTAAGVDAIFFDCTNNTSTWRREYQELFTALHDARADGIDAPKVCFITPFDPKNVSSKENVTRIYLNAYKDGKWSDLWFYWEGKPLILAYQDTLVPYEGDEANAELMEEINSFFTFRGPQPSYTSGQVLPNQWGWLEIYPQNGYTPNEDGTFEQATVGVAANHSYVRHSLTAMNDNQAMGRSYTSVLGQDKSAGAYKYGYFFTEQFKRAMELDPELMFIDGWNEWRAGRYVSWGGITNASPDTYDNEGSRDMEPTKGDMKDNYYYLLCDAVRRFKGTEPLAVAGPEKTIDISDFSGWDSVTPEYLSYKGSYKRDCIGYGSVTYTNDSVRNNVIKSKVSRDADKFYFLAQCENAITSPKGNWMKLYIDTDRNHATGWQGYDLVINSPSTGDISRLNILGETEKIGVASYNVSGDKLALAIDKSLITGEFEFKWVDNAEGDIMNLYNDGRTAPIGRFNFVFTERQQEYKGTDSLYQTVLVKKGSNIAYYEGKKCFTYDPDTRYGTKDIDGVTYIPAALLYDTFDLRCVYSKERGIIKLRGVIDSYSTEGSLEARKDGYSVAISHALKTVDGIPYVPVSYLSEIFGLEIYENGNVTAFGKNIDKRAVDAFAF